MQKIESAARTRVGTTIQIKTGSAKQLLIEAIKNNRELLATLYSKPSELTCDSGTDKNKKLERTAAALAGDSLLKLLVPTSYGRVSCIFCDHRTDDLQPSKSHILCLHAPQNLKCPFENCIEQDIN